MRKYCPLAHRWLHLGSCLILLALSCMTWAQDTPPATPSRPRVTTGGWLGALYQDSREPGHTSFFNVSALYLHGKLRLSDKWLTFAEVELENQPDPWGESESEVLLERLYIEYKWSEKWKLRIGKFNTQAGIVKPLHWDFTLDAVGLPIMESNGYVPAKSLGLELFGTRVLKQGVLSYDFSLSHSDDELQSQEAIEDAQGGGFDINFARPDRFKIGFSGYFYTDPKEDERNAKALLPYGELVLVPGVLSWRSEVLVLLRGSDQDIFTWYTALKYQWHRNAYLYFRFDRGDDERFAQGRTRETQSLTLGFRPTPRLRLKAEYARDNFPESVPVDRWSVWTGWLLR